MRKFLALIVSALAVSSFNLSNDVGDDVKYKMFCCACAKIESTSQDYIVLKVKNMNTGEVKDICTTPNLLSGALWRETGKMSVGLNCKEYPKRYFEFSKDNALWNIGFNDYSLEKLNTLRKHLNTDSIVKKVKKGNFHAVNVGKYEKYFAHIMFNLGVVTTSGCFGTSIRYFNPASLCER